jgi:hypothetical protein
MASTLVPLPQDTLRFDDSSFTTGSQVVTQNMKRIGSIDFTGATNTPNFTVSSGANWDTHGSTTLISDMVVTANNSSTNFMSRSACSFDSGGHDWNGAINIYTPAVTLKNNFTFTGLLTMASYGGSLICVDGGNNWALSAGGMTLYGGTLTLGSATHLVTAAGFSVYAGLTLTSFTGTLKFTAALTSAFTFTGGGKTTYGNFWNATTGAYPMIIADSNTFKDFKIDAGREMNFTGSKTTTVTTFTALGTSDAHIVIHPVSGTATLTKAGGGVISGCDYIDASYLTGSPADTWYIGANSTDAVGSSLTNIYLTDQPSTANTTNFFQFIN